MAISQAVYAAQFIDKDGNAFKFDDIGCMIRFVRENNRRETVARFYVMSYNDKHWLVAEQALFVKSEQAASPMASGLTAFTDAPQARDYATKKQGKIIPFDELWKGDVAEPSRHDVKPR